jgi:hypothetical protein
MWKSTCFIKSKLRRNTRLSAENFPDLLLWQCVRAWRRNLCNSDFGIHFERIPLELYEFPQIDFFSGNKNRLPGWQKVKVMKGRRSLKPTFPMPRSDSKIIPGDDGWGWFWRRSNSFQIFPERTYITIKFEAKTEEVLKGAARPWNASRLPGWGPACVNLTIK